MGDNKVVSIGDSGKISVAGLRRAVDRVKRLPRRYQAILESYRDNVDDIHHELTGLQAGVDETRLRIGFLACDDVGAALDFSVFGTQEKADAARRAGGSGAGLAAAPRGLSLLEYALGPESLELNRILTGTRGRS